MTVNDFCDWVDLMDSEMSEATREAVRVIAEELSGVAWMLDSASPPPTLDDHVKNIVAGVLKTVVHVCAQRAALVDATPMGVAGRKFVLGEMPKPIDETGYEHRSRDWWVSMVGKLVDVRGPSGVGHWYEIGAMVLPTEDWDPETVAFLQGNGNFHVVWSSPRVEAREARA